MTKDEAGKEWCRVMAKLSVLRTAAEAMVEKEGSGFEDEKEGRGRMGRYYDFVDGAEIIIAEAIYSLREIDDAG